MKSKSPTTQRRQLANIGPMEQIRAGQMPRRLIQLIVGLALFGFSLSLMLRATLGAMPWDVLSTGLMNYLPLSFGVITILTSGVVLLLWIPLKQMPGLGTIANALLVGVFADLSLSVVPEPDSLWLRIAFLAGGITLNAASTAMYIGSQLGPGPRDGLMTGLNRATGKSIRLMRTSIEISVVVLGFALGGALGVGTVIFAFSIGPLVQLMLPWFTIDLRIPTPATEDIPSGS